MGGPLGRTTTRFFGWVIVVYLMGVLQPFMGANFIDFSWNESVRQGDLVGLVMLIYIAAVWDPDTVSYLYSIPADAHLKALGQVISLALYVVGLSFLANTRDSRFVSASYTLPLGWTLVAIYILATCIAMFARLFHAETH